MIAPTGSSHSSKKMIARALWVLWDNFSLISAMVVWVLLPSEYDTARAMLPSHTTPGPPAPLRAAQAPPRPPPPPRSPPRSRPPPTNTHQHPPTPTTTHHHMLPFAGYPPSSGRRTTPRSARSVLPLPTPFTPVPATTLATTTTPRSPTPPNPSIVAQGRSSSHLAARRLSVARPPFSSCTQLISWCARPLPCILSPRRSRVARSCGRMASTSTSRRRGSVAGSCGRWISL